jgi:hypothetical protein
MSRQSDPELSITSGTTRARSSRRRSAVVDASGLPDKPREKLDITQQGREDCGCRGVGRGVHIHGYPSQNALTGGSTWIDVR